ncbi:DUF4135 domain-containing protein, partial [Bacillus licheniformis]|uniref:DUF4135 domain-containing protein n=1 Tax=Bacillus licheniformis TaxID=1402 RepID=UPI0011AA54C0
LKQTSLTTDQKFNPPKLNRPPVSPLSYTHFILQPFKNPYPIIIKHKQQLPAPSAFFNLFNHHQLRHLFRPTHLYGNFLQPSTHPDYF